MSNRIQGGGLELRQAHAGVTAEQLQQAAKDNRHDEVVFRADNGDLYVAIGRDLTVDGQRPKVGESVALSGKSGVVVHAEHELNPRKLAAAFVAGGLAAGLAVTGATVGAHDAMMSAMQVPLLGPILAVAVGAAEMVLGYAITTAGLATGAGAGTYVLVSADRSALHALTEPVA